MKMHASRWLMIGILAMAAATAAASDMPGPLGKKQQLKGVVVETTTDHFLVRGTNGAATAVRLMADTEIKEKRSNFLRERLEFRRSDITPGLKLVVEGRFDSNGVLWAEEVKFTQDNLKVAQIVDASLVPVESRLDELQEASGRLWGQVDELSESSRELRSDLKRTAQTADEAREQAVSAHHRIDGAESRIRTVEGRLSNLAEYQLGESVAVYFEAGRSDLTEEGKRELDRIVEVLGDGRGMLLEVTGFASADGSEALNRRLSERRAETVMQYLAEQHRLPLRLFVNPHGFGELLPAADNSTREGRRLNRRAEVRILINQGLRASSETAG